MTVNRTWRGRARCPTIGKPARRAYEPFCPTLTDGRRTQTLDLLSRWSLALRRRPSSLPEATAASASTSVLSLHCPAVVVETRAQKYGQASYPPWRREGHPTPGGGQWSWAFSRQRWPSRGAGSGLDDHESRAGRALPQHRHPGSCPQLWTLRFGTHGALRSRVGSRSRTLVLVVPERRPHCFAPRCVHYAPPGRHATTTQLHPCVSAASGGAVVHGALWRVFQRPPGEQRNGPQPGRQIT